MATLKAATRPFQNQGGNIQGLEDSGLVLLG